MSERTASEPFPESGFISNNGAISSGMPNLSKTGERAVKSFDSNPLTANNSERISTVAIYGKMLVTSGIAPFAPFVKASYVLTFLCVAYANERIKIQGITQAKNVFIAYLPPAFLYI